MPTSKILSVGMHVPPRVVTNKDLESMMDTTNEWIVQRSGIEQRHWVDEQCTSDLAYEASLEAIEKAGIDKNEIDMIVTATISPDHDFPGLGCFLHAKLGLNPIPAFDVRQQCSGFIYAMSLADSYIKTGMAKTVLVVGAEIHSKGLDISTEGRAVSVLFGDGAGAMILQASEDDSRGIMSTHMWTQGEFAKDLWAAAPGSAMEGGKRISKEILDEGLHYPIMNGKKVFTHAVKRMPEALIHALKVQNTAIEDVDLFIFHQANLRINQFVADALKIPGEKVFNTIQKYGNTTAATIPIGLAEAVKAGKLKEGMLVASAAFGSGFTWASSLYRW